MKRVLPRQHRAAERRLPQRVPCALTVRHVQKRRTLTRLPTPPGEIGGTTGAMVERLTRTPDNARQTPLASAATRCPLANAAGAVIAATHTAATKILISVFTSGTAHEVPSLAQNARLNRVARDRESIARRTFTRCSRFFSRSLSLPGTPACIPADARLAEGRERQHDFRLCRPPHEGCRPARVDGWIAKVRYRDDSTAEPPNTTLAHLPRNGPAP